MKKVSFIIVRAAAVFLIVFCAGLVPQNKNFSMNAAVAQASEIDNENTSKARLTVNDLTLVVDDSYTLRVRNVDKDSEQSVIYKSSDTDVASVKYKKRTDTKAEITANSVGTATITVFIKEGAKSVKTLKCSITVGPPAQSVKFVDSKVELEVGEKTTLKAILLPGNTAEGAQFESSDTEIAAVTKSGCVVAKAKGTVTITVSISNGTTDTCTILVK